MPENVLDDSWLMVIFYSLVFLLSTYILMRENLFIQFIRREGRGC